MHISYHNLATNHARTRNRGTSNEQPYPSTCTRRTNLCNLADPAHSSLVLGVILGHVIGTRDAGRALVDRRVGRSADFELGELVEVNVDSVVGIAFTNSLDLSCLDGGSVNI
jgi:hypothetical protein